MKTIKELYRIGLGPSSSHTIAPSNAAKIFRDKTHNTFEYQVTLYGSLAATGKGHLTDHAIKTVFNPVKCNVVWKKNEELPMHPNGMVFSSYDKNHDLIDEWTVYSTGGGAINDFNNKTDSKDVYPFNTMNELLKMCDNDGKVIWNYVDDFEGAEIWNYLDDLIRVMKDSIDSGINQEGVLPGDIKLRRKASQFHAKAKNSSGFVEKNGIIFSYALAVAEENASGKLVVTAPTCGSAGVVPAVIFSLKELNGLNNTQIKRALATAGLIGNLIKNRGSISGAEVGCQGEIGTACAMAAGAAAQLMGGTPHQIEYAAEMGMEHHLGLTCDPILGLVQIPCIERNAFASVRAVDCAAYAILSDGRHMVSFDEVVDTMAKTGRDLKKRYRETSEGGLAVCYTKKI